MPAILHPDDEDDWLNPQLSLQDAQALLVPFPAALMTAYRANRAITSYTLVGRPCDFTL
jgi:putative SOS response-associated peptidase YedK